MEPYIGEIKLFAGSFAPRGWMLCDGSLLSIHHHHTLYTLLDTTYGGDGMQTFALPDLRGRAPIHPGQGRGLSNKYECGQTGGSESVSLTQQQMPAHSHALQAVPAAANQAAPEGNYFSIHVDGVSGNADSLYNDGSDTTIPIAKLNAASVAPVGGNQPIGIMQPYLAINYIIAIEGIYPSRP